MRFRSLITALLVLAGLGCGHNAKNPIVPVSGKVLFADGKPLPAGTRLLFNPAEGGNQTARGVTATDGTIQVTHATGAAGAEVGKYAVLLVAPEGDNGTFFKLVPRDYYDGGILTAEVREGMAPLEFKVRTR